MESPDLTPSSRPGDDPLDARLRQPAPPLPDADFTRGVLAALPPRGAPKLRPAAWPWRPIAIGAGAFAGLAVAVLRAGSAAVLENELLALNAALAQSGALLNQPGALPAFVITALSLVYVFYFAPPRRR